MHAKISEVNAINNKLYETHCSQVFWSLIDCRLIISHSKLSYLFIIIVIFLVDCTMAIKENELSSQSLSNPNKNTNSDIPFSCNNLCTKKILFFYYSDFVSKFFGVSRRRLERNFNESQNIVFIMDTLATSTSKKPSTVKCIEMMTRERRMKMEKEIWNHNNNTKTKWIRDMFCAYKCVRASLNNSRNNWKSVVSQSRAAHVLHLLTTFAFHHWMVGWFSSRYSTALFLESFSIP